MCRRDTRRNCGLPGRRAGQSCCDQVVNRKHLLAKTFASPPRGYHCGGRAAGARDTAQRAGQEVSSGGRYRCIAHRLRRTRRFLATRQFGARRLNPAEGPTWRPTLRTKAKPTPFGPRTADQRLLTPATPTTRPVRSKRPKTPPMNHQASFAVQRPVQPRCAANDAVANTAHETSSVHIQPVSPTGEGAQPRLAVSGT